MSTKRQYGGAEVGMSSRVNNSKKCFQFGTECWRRTGVENVIR